MTAARKAKSPKRKKKQDSFELELLRGARRFLKAFVITLSAIKTLNEAVQNGTYLMKLKPTPVSFDYMVKGVKKRKTLYLDTYQVKGIKGMIRHLLMVLLDSIGISVCHSTDRLTFGQKETPTIPSDSHVHPLGACVKEDDKTRADGCLIYQLFGGMLEQSIIRVEPILVAKANNDTIPKTATNLQASRKVFFVHSATEARNVLTIEQKPIQDFREGYFDGEFVISIEVTHCRPEQIGALAEALFRAEELGRSKTTGYGKITIDRVELVEVTQQRQIVKTENGLEKQIKSQQHNLGMQLHEAYAAWEAYKESYRMISKKELATALMNA
jgi:CRISPR/Cas system CSM-associated protein Csm3 (group 7 of RAMP superfamily)